METEEKLKLEIKDTTKKAIFLEKLKKRYNAEHSKYSIDEEHYAWWLEDQGIGRENGFLEFLVLLEQFIGKLKNKLVVDMGCGSGASLISLSALNAKVIGIENDTYGDDLALAGIRCAIYGFSPQMINGDATSSPFKSDTFDLVLSTSVIEHIENYQDYLQEIYRILKPGGIAYILTNNRIFPYDSHSGLYFFNWLPHICFELARNIKCGYPLRSKFCVWHVSTPKLKRELNKMGFNVIADWSKFYMQRNKERKDYKHLIVKSLIKSGMNISTFAPRNEFLVQKQITS